MKLLSSELVVSLISIVGFVKYASSIFCYDCNSAFDPRCGVDFEAFSLGTVNCSLKDPLTHMPNATPTLCRTIKMDIHGKVRVVRKCGYTVDDDTIEDLSCRRQAGTGDVFVTYCACDTDLCNSALAHTGNMAAMLMVSAVVTARVSIC